MSSDFVIARDLLRVCDQLVQAATYSRRRHEHVISQTSFSDFADACRKTKKRVVDFEKATLNQPSATLDPS